MQSRSVRTLQAELHRSSGAKKRRHQDDKAEGYPAIHEPIQGRKDSTSLRRTTGYENQRVTLFKSCPSLRSAHTLCGLLQDRDLPRMIELMLCDSMQHVIEVISLAGNAVA